MRELSVADYFIEFLIENGITDVFGYQGGMIAYIFDSMGKYKDRITYHPCGNEQAAAFEACAWAQTTGKCGIAISTSGPGFTNLLTGMANAWFDSLPVMFVSGNVNTKDKKRDRPLKQDGFQEIQAVQVAKPIVKKTYELELGMNYIDEFNDALATAMSGRKGPVYIDLPINICRERVQFDDIKAYKRVYSTYMNDDELSSIVNSFKNAKRPLIIAGAGIKQCRLKNEFIDLVNFLDVPVVTTLPAIDLLAKDNPYNCGFIGATGRREAGLILKNSDFILSLGTRLCSKQLGHNLANFAPNAKLVRVDVDDSEFVRKVKPDEKELKVDLQHFIYGLDCYLKTHFVSKMNHSKWMSQCKQIKDLLREFDITPGNKVVEDITSLIMDGSNIVFDVGKNMQYNGQSTVIRKNTEVFMSAGLGSMGYSIPAAIGAYLGNKKPTYSFNGDGGALMNIQELNTIAKANLPIKILVLNNKALGNIRLFQESYLDNRYVGTTEDCGDYYSTDFVKVAEGFGIKGFKFNDAEQLKDYLYDDKPYVFEFEYEDCPSLPGIVACGDFINGGPSLPDEVKVKLNEIVEDI